MNSRLTIFFTEMKKTLICTFTLLASLVLYAQTGMLLDESNNYKEVSTNIEYSNGRIFTLGATVTNLILREFNENLEVVVQKNYEIGYPFLVNMGMSFKTYDDYMIWGGKQDVHGIIAKISYDLDTIWTKRYNVDGYVTIYDTHVQSGDNIYMIGRARIPPMPGELWWEVEDEFSILKINSNGDSLYSIINNFHDRSDVFMCAKMISANRILLSGSKMHPWDVQVAMTDTLGSIVWEQTLGGDLFDSFSYMAVLDTTAIVCYFECYGTFTDVEWMQDQQTTDSLALTSINIETGEINWTKKHFTAKTARVTSCKELIDGNFIITGIYLIDEQTQLRSFAMKFNANGDEIWKQDYAYSNSYLGYGNELYDIEELDSGELVLIGYYWDQEGLQKTWILKTNALGEPINLALPDESKEFSVYPNPVSDVLTVKSVNNEPIEHINIYDIQGKQVARETLNSSNQIDFSKHQSGLYIIQIHTENGVVSKTVVKE